MILLIPQRPQQIQHALPFILALLGHGVFEISGEGAEEVAAGFVEDDGGLGFEVGEGGVEVVLAEGELAVLFEFFVLEGVADVAEEVEPVFGGPEEGVGEDCGGLVVEVSTAAA